MRFAVAVLGAGIVQIVPYQRLDLWIGAGAALALLYIGFAAFGAGFFAGRRTVLAGAFRSLSVRSCTRSSRRSRTREGIPERSRLSSSAPPSRCFRSSFLARSRDGSEVRSAREP